MILITGATGNVGREVVNLLVEDGRQVVAVSRNPKTPSLPAKAHVVAGDPSRPQTIATAFKGIDAVLLSPRAVAGAASDLVMLAVSSGVRRGGRAVRPGGDTTCGFPLDRSGRRRSP